ncbi:MAG: hypothetical protein RMK20_14465, partial [Verrucomicrobiales bacterium]|nr:hypothetical protein [Verrucomicrobiales bacterium]
QGNANRTRVESLGTTIVTNLNSEFPGLYGFVSNYRVLSHARLLNHPSSPWAGVSQEIQFASIPVFQFAIFYGIDLEINPGPVMHVTGKVHSNADIYAAPVSGLTFWDTVTAVGLIYHNRHPNDGTVAGQVTPVYRSLRMEKVSALTLPVGPDNNPETIRQILDPPPFGEDPNSNLGKERFYNKAHLIIRTTSTNTAVFAGRWNNFTYVPPDQTNNTYSFIRTTNSLNDLRETKWTILTELDVRALTNWLARPTGGAGLNTLAKSITGQGINSIYIEDQRTHPSRLTAVRVINGRYLPQDGLTIATRLPIYVQGDFNAPALGTTNTSAARPAALIGDSITVLSTNWTDNNAGKSLTQRPAAPTTVNAAFLGGIVKSVKIGNNKFYSGGVENFPRFLEDWDGRAFTYNGSMVVLFESRFATNRWQPPGNYYNAPNRNWAFDVNYLNPSKLPPMTPQFRKLVRGKWQVVAAR